MSERSEAFQAHIARWEKCTRCKIGEWAFKHAFGVGNLYAPCVFIGEGPGASEDTLGVPFVGPAGRLLQKALLLSGFRAEDWFLTNLVCCRPRDSENGGNRPPNPEEVANCRPRLNHALGILKPKIVVAVGNVPADYLLNGLQALNGPIHYEKIKHPAWLLRQGGERSDAWGFYIDNLRRLRRAYGIGDLAAKTVA